jgi:polyisoprenoid-binding protein YceI
MEMPSSTPMQRAMPRLPACLLLLLLPRFAAAVPTEIALVPGDATVAFRAYGLGLLPLDGNFTRFEGILTYDETGPRTCRVSLSVDVASLATSETAIRDNITGPEFMDAALFPMLTFEGECRGDDLVGQLAMHGVTRAFALDLERTRSGITAQGRLRRADWGMTARPLLGGTTVRITVRVQFPQGAR